MNQSPAVFQLSSVFFLFFLQLFDFDREVEPILEVLVGKVMEQSLAEVMEEEELATLKAQQRAFEELRNYELAEVQRLQEQERRRKEEKVGTLFKLEFDYLSQTSYS